MSFVQTLSFSSLLLSSVYAAAVPTTTASLPTRAVDCTDLTAPLDSSCWATLGLTAYVQNWWTTYGAGCGQAGFATCFLNQKHLTTQNCEYIVNDACTPPIPTSLANTSDFYVAYNIYAINQAFNSYYNALSDANTLASENVPAMIQLLDPPVSHNVLLNDLLTALSVGLSFVAIDNPVVAAMVTAASQVAAVSKFVFPTGTTNSQNVQLGQLQHSLGTLVQTAQGNINSAMPEVMNDPTSFLAFAGTGVFSQTSNTSLFSDTRPLLQGLNTYVLAQCMTANNILLARAPNVDINEWAISGTIANYNTDCGSGYDAEGICDDWWWDATTNVTYSMVKSDSSSTNYHNAMETMFSNWTTPAQLFVNAASCHDGTNGASNASLISATPTGINSACLASMQVCTWDTDDSNNNFVEAPFVDCGAPGGWLDETCGDASKVPYGYIGPEMWVSNGGYGACR